MSSNEKVLSALKIMYNAALACEGIKDALKTKNERARKEKIALALGRFKGLAVSRNSANEITRLRYARHGKEYSRTSFGWSDMRDLAVFVLDEQGIFPDLELVELMFD
jgi:predicted NodU family carbamoyl transferase